MTVVPAATPPTPVEIPEAILAPVPGPAAAPTVASCIEPTVGGAFARAWEILTANFRSLLVIGFVAWLFDSAIGMALDRVSPAAGLLWLPYEYLVGIPVSFGALYAWLRAARGERPSVEDLFVPFRRAWLSCVLAELLATAMLGVGFLLLILPGVFLAVRLAFVPFLIVDEGRGPVDALSESFRRTTGRFWTTFGVGLLGLVLAVVATLPELVWPSMRLSWTVLASIVADMLAYLALASLYAAITARLRDAPAT